METAINTSRELANVSSENKIVKFKFKVMQRDKSAIKEKLAI